MLVYCLLVTSGIALTAGSDYNNLATFTDFIQHAVHILNKYEDEDLEHFFTIFNDEIRKYHYRGCKFHELIDNYKFRTFIANRLDAIKYISAADIRSLLTLTSKKLEDAIYDKNEKELIDFINSLYREQSIDTFKTVLHNINKYRIETRKNSDLIDLVVIISGGLRSIVFDHFSELNHNARIALKNKLDEYWRYFKAKAATDLIKMYFHEMVDDNDNNKHESVHHVVRAGRAQDIQTTFKQMYVEKNLDLKYDIDAYNFLSTKRHNQHKQSHKHTTPSTEQTKSHKKHGRGNKHNSKYSKVNKSYSTETEDTTARHNHSVFIEFMTRKHYNRTRRTTTGNYHLRNANTSPNLKELGSVYKNVKHKYKVTAINNVITSVSSHDNHVDNKKKSSSAEAANTEEGMSIEMLKEKKDKNVYHTSLRKPYVIAKFY